MAARKLDIKNYCDTLYGELFGIKTKLNEFVTMIEYTEGKERQTLGSYSRHLQELISFIDWKLEIFNKVCPVDWNRFTHDVESTVSVPPMEGREESDLPAGGYVGG
ncbi:MAG: hypothetical protein JSU90_05695 [Nitrospiraceae bacterium]|nr:MAG: hypothetical protein JSU90_05695 [Nitrospiraceae bacterium]